MTGQKHLWTEFGISHRGELWLLWSWQKDTRNKDIDRCHTSMKNQTKFDCIIWWDLICSNSTSWRSHSRQVPSRLIWEHRPRRLALPLLEWRPKRNQTISLEGAWALRPDPLGSWVEEAQPLRFGHNLICLLCNSSKMLPYLFDILRCKLNTYLHIMHRSRHDLKLVRKWKKLSGVKCK